MESRDTYRRERDRKNELGRKRGMDTGTERGGERRRKGYDKGQEAKGKTAKGENQTGSDRHKDRYRIERII